MDNPAAAWIATSQSLVASARRDRLPTVALPAIAPSMIPDIGLACSVIDGRLSFKGTLGLSDADEARYRESDDGRSALMAVEFAG